MHRDLKPDNVFVTKTGEVKVLDFGVARWNDGKSSSDMTGVGMVLGTPAYMPPEQALGRREDVDAQSDLWAVGATLFVVLSGESVHAGGDAKAKLIATARTRGASASARPRPRRAARGGRGHRSRARVPQEGALARRRRDARGAALGAHVARRSPERAVAATSEPELEPIARRRCRTRRTIDDEPTIARERTRRSSLPPAPSDGPVSRDFLTSAPPITLRDGPKPVAGDRERRDGLDRNEPVFSLRRRERAKSHL